MSYALRLAGDATADLQQLDPWLAEAVLDEIYALTADPSRLRPDELGEAVHDLERQLSGVRHIVLLRVQLDADRRVLTLFTIVDLARP